jgi:hypothetical protein
LARIPWGEGSRGGRAEGEGGGRAQGAGGGAHVRVCVRACVHAPFDLPPIAITSMDKKSEAGWDSVRAMFAARSN